MKLARAELVSLVLRSARGAGLPLGWAEDLSRAARHFGQDALAEYAKALEDKDCFETLFTILDRSALGEPAVPETALFKALRDDKDKVLPPTDRPDISDDILRALERHAAATYVPETEASRANDAGAGADQV
ncbi:hypothetical protein [Thalassococcus sp. S3]|uniref:hypothetical protein n=1 Tax=Thalassococcus sp. S3 TaxID=2017482 RepID=UPI00102430E9|nr:hypothetical protein [Thalassococcus sp. S3]QBF33001.1 hypothetical protein CFI11_17495 [Thalassococcus sp. S3]